MAFKSQFFNAVNNDRVYSAEDMARALDVFVSSGILYRPESFYPHESFYVFRREASNFKLAVAPGKAIIKGYTVASVDQGSILIDIPSANGLARKDLVVLELDTVNRTIDLRVLGGTATTFPTVTQTNTLYQLPLAEITVPSNYVTGNDTLLGINDVRQWSVNNAQGFKANKYITFTLEGGWTHLETNKLRFTILPNGLLHVIGVIYHGTQANGTVFATFPNWIDFPNTFWQQVTGRSYNVSIAPLSTIIMDVKDKATTGGSAKLAVGRGTFDDGWGEMEWASINALLPCTYTGSYGF